MWDAASMTAFLLQKVPMEVLIAQHLVFLIFVTG